MLEKEKVCRIKKKKKMDRYGYIDIKGITFYGWVDFFE